MTEITHITEVANWETPKFAQTSKNVIDACQLGLAESGLLDHWNCLPEEYWDNFFKSQEKPKRFSSINHLMVIHPSRYNPAPANDTVVWVLSDPKVVLEMVILPTQDLLYAEQAKLKVLKLIDRNFKGVEVNFPQGTIVFPKSEFAEVIYEERLPYNIPENLLREWQ